MAENKTNFWKWMVALLAVLNVVLLLTVWSKPSGGPKQLLHRAPGEGPGKMIIQELDFSEKQIYEFNGLKEEHHSAVAELQEKGRELRDDFFDLLKQDNPDQKLVSAMADSIAANQKKIEMVTFIHFEKVKQLCNPAQRKKFDRIINDVLHMMAGPHRRENGPPPPGPPPNEDE